MLKESRSTFFNVSNLLKNKFFQKTVKVVPHHPVPMNGNIISSHVIYEAKRLDGDSLKMKAWIASHGNKDQKRSTLKTDSASCVPVGIRIVAAITTFHKWRLLEIDVISTFQQTGKALHDVYVIPPTKSRDTGFL